MEWMIVSRLEQLMTIFQRGTRNTINSQLNLREIFRLAQSTAQSAPLELVVFLSRYSFGAHSYRFLNSRKK